MTKTTKYIKTRGQRMMNDHVNSQPLAELPYRKTLKSYFPTLNNNVNQVQPMKKQKRPYVRKMKKITKENPKKLKQVKVKKYKQKLIKIKKYKQKIAQNGDSTLLAGNIPQGKVTKQTIKVKLQNGKKNKSKLTSKEKPFESKSQKPKPTVKYVKKIKTQTKKEQANSKRQSSLIKQVSQPKIKQKKSLSKAQQKQQKGSKSKITIANQDSPSLLNNHAIKLEPQVQPKKKGRPRKVIQLNGTKTEERTLDEQKILDGFVQNAIKLRKLKNQRQFFESFSRIIEYMRESWEFGDLSKTLKKLPNPEDVLNIGIQISRGIRKQLQLQAITQQTV